MHGGTDGASDDMRERGFAESGGAAEEDVSEDVIALGGGFDHEHEAFFDFLLAAEFAEYGGSEGDIEGGLGCTRGLGVEIVAHSGWFSWEEGGRGRGASGQP